MKVRPATIRDAQRCVEISKIRAAQELAALLRNPEVQWLVLEDDAAAVVGIGIINYWPWNRMAWVWDLTIDKAARGKGCGAVLLKGMIDAARKMGARVLMDFDAARPNDLCNLYLRNGFRICGTNDRWFADQKEATAVFYGYDLT
jgi:GNAT superfamily N-acetyltransferase